METYEKAYTQARQRQFSHEDEGHPEIALAYAAEATTILKELAIMRSIPLNKKIILRSEHSRCVEDEKRLQELVAVKFSYLTPTPESNGSSSPIVYPSSPQEAREGKVACSDVSFEPGVQPFKTGPGWAFVPCLYCGCEAAAHLFTPDILPEQVEETLQRCLATRHPCVAVTYGHWEGCVELLGVEYTSGIIIEPIERLFDEALQVLRSLPTERRLVAGQEMAKGLARLLIYLGGGETPCALIDKSAIAVGLSMDGPGSVKIFDSFCEPLSEPSTLFAELGDAIGDSSVSSIGDMSVTRNAYDILNALEGL